MRAQDRHINQRAFSLLELVIVVVVIGIIAAIAVLRIGSAADNSRVAAISANLVVLEKAVQFYAAEHEGRGPATEPDGTVDADTVWLIARLVGYSDVAGRMGAGNPLGPYLQSVPKNPMNGLDTIRIDGANAGRNAAGWRFDSVTSTFQADDSPASASIVAGATSRSVDMGNQAADGSTLETTDDGR